LAPHSPGTDQIEALLWVGFVVFAIVVVAVIGGLLYSLRRYRGERGDEPRQTSGGRGVQLRVGVVLSVFALAVFVVATIFTEKAREVPTTGPDGLAAAKSSPLEITATGQQWIWRYDYPNESFSYYKLVVPVDTTVSLDLVSTDVVHTWDVPELAGKRDAVPGKHSRVVFRADEEGNFDGQAATMSGQAYASMRTEVEVVSPEQYEAFVKAQRQEIQQAQDRVVDLIAKGETP
jgi:cytochrome c oxidase subunit 2